MATEFIFKPKPTREEVLLNNYFADMNWDEPVHADPDHLQFFDTPDKFALLLNNGAPVSTLVIYSRSLEYQGKKYTFSGIGGVATHKQFRHKGFATELLKQTMRSMKDDYDFSLLCTNISKLSPLYEKVGFVPLVKPYYFIDKNGKKDIETGAMIAPLSSPDSVDLILSTPDEVFVGISNF